GRYRRARPARKAGKLARGDADAANRTGMVPATDRSEGCGDLVHRKAPTDFSGTERKVTKLCRKVPAGGAPGRGRHSDNARMASGWVYKTQPLGAGRRPPFGFSA